MIFLVDTNVWLERLLEQENANEVKNFFDAVPSANLALSDFSYHSVGVIMSKTGKAKKFIEFTDDLFINSSVSLFSITPAEMHKLVKAINDKYLDFDDAYQYIVSNLYHCQIVSFDSDFKKKGIKILSPHEAMQKYLKEK